MTHNQTSKSHKNTPNKLSNQVKSILQEKGFSSVFNWQDYQYFKDQVKTAFNKSQAIAEKFIEDNNYQNSDFNEYIF
ncbi:hypothetical protein LIT13_01360 [Flavobacterium psychrophilum]|uniref:Uncharacterized protein n=6 Tax=root TaxID=1 RepID=A6GXR7_FLAPJ|nr:hypothetical protein [Flavobacterium psychrophilum]YP_008320429.1 hypothetical protein N375_gp15 [Flavobacterium phage 6H]YP_009321832.1 hypothetical protein BOX11_gp11 [Flavobacterium phage 1H]YP_009322889.1 hypothetical protein BOX10_gp17 [Flavobacterium phage 2A]YP_009592323.1 hypothetical protein FDG69_gp15 [Flavobacterium phage 23T]QCW20067.1 hypothetical protein [Flavobacterium phage FPSV-D15]QCW20222.1 hypothetical protein [Flavobacterium phage FPSV-F7]AGN89398.1 hypothetical prote